MIARMSKLRTLRPRYAISLGNQIDLTLSDYLHWLVDHDPVQVIACYIEGFKAHDGSRFLAGVRKARAAGRDVVVYKAGRTPAGQASSAGHTASLAGDYDTAAHLLEQAGAWVCHSFAQFEDAITLLSCFDGCKPAGCGVAAMSNAGFESVGLGDNSVGVDLFEFAPATADQIRSVLSSAKIDGLVDVRNPLDITPMANDAIYAGCIQAMLSDPKTDAAIISAIPLTPAMQTLPPGEGHRDDCTADTALPALLDSLLNNRDKPIIMTIDSGSLYDPYVRLLESRGVPVLREADRAMKRMASFMSYALGHKLLTGITADQ